MTESGIACKMKAPDRREFREAAGAAMWNLIHRRRGGSRPTSRLAQNSGTLCNRVGIEQAAMAEPEVEAAWRAELERIARLDVKNEEGYKRQIPRSSKNSAAAF
jgi:hypothetical protein